MRVDARVTSLSWIPKEAMSGLMKVPMDLGISHYDRPPPEHIDDLEALRQGDRFRFANDLSAWIEVEAGQIVSAGYSGGGQIGATTLALGVGHVTIPAVPFPDQQEEPEISGDRARFVQTAGGRTGAPMPRRVDSPPFFTITSPTAWTTMALEIATDGSTAFEMVNASPFPRHWVYDDSGDLVEETGLIDFKSWTREHFGDHTPWGHVGEPLLMTKVETSLERRLSEDILAKGHKPEIRRLDADSILVTQGEETTEMYLVMDGVILVEIDGDEVAQVGPGTILGERASVEGGHRTATLRTASPARVAVVSPDQVAPEIRRQIAAFHGGEPAEG